MSERGASIPLVFALALSASAGAAALQVKDRAQLLTPGSLRTLLTEDPAAVGDAAPDNRLGHAMRQLSQWFNSGWSNCFSGAWRRC